MLLGQSLRTGDGDALTYFGPWMLREADAATFVAEVMLISGGAFTLTITIEHKNSEDPDSAAGTAATFANITAETTATKEATGLKELVRYKYVLTGTNGVEWVHMRMNPPIWQPN